MKITLDEGAYMPEKAHKEDAGFDLRLPSMIDCNGVSVPWGGVQIAPGGSVFIPTGVHIELPFGFAAVVMNKSGLAKNKGIETVLGLVDSGFTGNICVTLKNNGEKPVAFQPGDKISQLVVFPISTEPLVQVDHLEETERGNGGFGSTGK